MCCVFLECQIVVGECRASGGSPVFLWVPFTHALLHIVFDMQMICSSLIYSVSRVWGVAYRIRSIESVCLLSAVAVD